MKLGTQTGSLCNAMMETTSYLEPVPGMGATILAWTDRYPATVLEFDAKRKVVTLLEDKAHAIGQVAFTEDQRWSYEFDPKGAVYKFRYKDGRWRGMQRNFDGRWVLCPKGQGHGLSLGEREKYYDPCF